MGYRNLVWLSNVDDLDKKLTGKDTWDINILLLRTDHGVCLTGAGIFVWTMVSAGAGMDGGGRPYVSMRF